MYSQQELDDAVASGAITAEAADALRALCRTASASIAIPRRRTVSPDHRLQRHFRLDRRGDPAVRGRLDRPVDRPATGPVIIDMANGPCFLAPLAVAATAWALALFFTARRRMALPSILLLLAFVGGVLRDRRRSRWSRSSARTLRRQQPAARRRRRRGSAPRSPPAAAWLHWRRFRVPITIAAGAAAVAGLVLALVVAHRAAERRESAENLILGFILLLGIGVFLFAMWWDCVRPRAR